jgi:hypothetical protein
LITLSRQRVPMLDATTLEGRTRPAVDGTDWVEARLRYLSWPTWSFRPDRAPSFDISPNQARLGHR